MTITFNVSDWRDAGFSRHSEEGHGTYIHDRVYTVEMTEEQWIASSKEGVVIYDAEHCIYFEEKDINLNGTEVDNCELCFNSYSDVSYKDLIEEFEDYLDWASEL